MTPLMLARIKRDLALNKDQACCVRSLDQLNNLPTLSVVMPVYNESSTLAQVIDRVRAEEICKEIIIVDDGSIDGTASLIAERGVTPGMSLLQHPANAGKGASLRTGFAKARGEIVIIQDADLEYDPADYAFLVEPIVNGEADVVFGSRFLPDAKASLPRRMRFANRFITWCFNRIHRQRLTDVESCYKAVRRELLLQTLPSLCENRFGIEIELAAKLLKIPGVRVLEVPIRYHARRRCDGKKIRFRDGLRALWCILKYR